MWLLNCRAAVLRGVGAVCFSEGGEHLGLPWQVQKRLAGTCGCGARPREAVRQDHMPHTWTVKMGSTSSPSSCMGKMAALFPT